jgi:hypothetical protein
MPRLLNLSVGLVFALLATTGCDQAASRADLGKVVYRMPDLPGADQPYELPELEGMKPLDEAAAGMDW